ncbi:MAG: MerR family transcriptional regulator, partial [Angelakisella sp.]
MLKIGDVSRVLGISSQSVRKYEELGIAQISKSEHSGYRQFNLRSLNQLLRVRFYRKAEFDLVTATKLINTIDLDFVADTLKHQQRVLAENIRILKYKQAKLAELGVGKIATVMGR